MFYYGSNPYEALVSAVDSLRKDAFQEGVRKGEKHFESLREKLLPITKEKPMSLYCLQRKATKIADEIIEDPEYYNNSIDCIEDPKEIYRLGWVDGAYEIFDYLQEAGIIDKASLIQQHFDNLEYPTQDYESSYEFMEEARDRLDYYEEINE